MAKLKETLQNWGIGLVIFAVIYLLAYSQHKTYERRPTTSESFQLVGPVVRNDSGIIIRSLGDVRLVGAKGEQLELVRIITSTGYSLPRFRELALFVKGSSKSSGSPRNGGSTGYKTFYQFPKAQLTRDLQSKGLLPNPIPVAQFHWSDYLISLRYVIALMLFGLGYLAFNPKSRARLGSFIPNLQISRT